MADDKPVKLSVELPGALYRELLAYAEVHAKATGLAEPLLPEKIAVPMIERFMRPIGASRPSGGGADGGGGQGRCEPTSRICLAAALDPVAATGCICASDSRQRGRKTVPDHRFASDAVQPADAGLDITRSAVAVEIRSYRHAREIRDWSAAWHHLERAHIIAQPIFRLHLASHAAMLTFAISQRDVREIFGQLLRVALVPLGALTGRLPTGNIGRARVSVFAPMPVPDDLRPYLRQDAS